MKTYLVFICAVLLCSCNNQEEKNLVESENMDSAQPLDSFRVLYELGNQKLGSNAFHEAIPLFSNAIRLNPGDPDAFYCRGYALSAVGKDSAAIIDYSEAIRLKPDHKGAYFSRAVSYSVIGHLNDAINDYSTVLTLDSLFSNAWFNRGLIKLQSGRKEAGLMDIKMAARLQDPKALEFLK